MIRGSCLCGEVRFEIDRASGPFELCHCNRCRKASGSAFVAGLTVRPQDFRFTRGAELIRRFELPIVESPPAYCTCFCGRCGSPLPAVSADGSRFEVPAGALDDDPGVRPDKRIFVDARSSWYEIADRLPRFTKQEIRAQRRAHPPSDDR